MKNNKNKLMVVLFIIETIVLIISLLYSSLVFMVNDAKTLWFREISDNGEYQVSCYEVGTALFFSSQKLSVSISKGSGLQWTSIASFETEIHNDGAAPNDENYDVRWFQDYVEIIFKSGDYRINTFIIPLSNEVKESKVAESTFIVELADGNNNAITESNLYQTDLSKTFTEIINSDTIKNKLFSKYGNINKLIVKAKDEYNTVYSVSLECGNLEENKCIEINDEYVKEFKELVEETYNINISILSKATISK